MTKKLIDQLRKQSKELRSSLYIFINLAEKNRKDVRGIIPFLCESERINSLMGKIRELRSICNIIILEENKAYPKNRIIRGGSNA